MKEEIKEMFGEKTKFLACKKCGEELIGIKEAIRMQEKLLPKIDEDRKVIKVGGSIAVTLPSQLDTIFKPGSTVHINFDSKNMELRVKKTV